MQNLYGWNAAMMRTTCSDDAANVRQPSGNRAQGRRTIAAQLAHTAIFAAALLTFHGPAVAQTAPGPSVQLFTPPEGCTLNMTVQERSCAVAQHYTCSADPAGDQRVVYFGQGGERTYEALIDAETRWLWSRDPQSGIVDTLEEGNPDDASFSTLVQTGKDDFDFWTVDSTGQRLHQVGEDQLTGDTVTIDGRTLERTRFKLTTTGEDGQVLITREGNQFISREMGRFFGGTENATDWTGVAESSDRSPVEFIEPGEPGFASTQPRYDCEMLTAGLELTPMQRLIGLGGS